MNIFVSWSGDRSESVAKAFRDWLPNIFQSANPWMSGVDIEKGVLWHEKILEKLRESKVDLICLTPENLKRPWINFEAGAIANNYRLEKNHICTILIDLHPDALEGPLKQYQATRLNKDDVFALVATINGALVKGTLSKKTLESAFKGHWPELETLIQKIPNSVEMAGRLMPELLSDLHAQQKISNPNVSKGFVIYSDAWIDGIGQFGIDLVYAYYYPNARDRKEKTVHVGFPLRGNDNLDERSRNLKEKVDKVFPEFHARYKTLHKPRINDKEHRIFFPLENPIGSAHKWTPQIIAEFTEKVIRYFADKMDCHAP